MEPKVKRVPAVDKCFAILDLLARSKEPVGISEISAKLGLNKSTVFSISHTLEDLNVLDKHTDGKYVFGTRFYILANMAGKRSELVQTSHPYMERISQSTGLSVFLGIRSESRTILVDKVDSTSGITITSEIGLRMPPLAGAGIKAMMAQLPEQEVKKILQRAELNPYTPNSITDKGRYLEEIRLARSEGVAFDREEYLEGMTGVAVPLKASGSDAQVAIWVVGLSQRMPDTLITDLTGLLKSTAEEINHRFQ